VCERERDRDRESVCVREKETDTERECVRDREKEGWPYHGSLVKEQVDVPVHLRPMCQRSA